MCAPAALAIASFAGSMLQARERNLQIRTANRQQQLAYTRNMMAARGAASATMSQRQAKLTQTSEAYAQRLQQLGIEGWKATAAVAVRPGQEHTQGTSAALVQQAYAAEGRATSAMGRQWEMDQMSARRGDLMDAQVAQDRTLSMWRPDQHTSRQWMDSFNAGMAALNTHTQSQGLFDTVKSDNSVA